MVGFNSVSNDIKKKIKLHSDLAIQALVAESQEDVARIVKIASQVAATSTRRHFERAGWFDNAWEYAIHTRILYQRKGP